MTSTLTSVPSGKPTGSVRSIQPLLIFPVIVMEILVVAAIIPIRHYNRHAMNEKLAQQLAARDRLRRHLSRQKTPRERMAEMARLQRRAREILQKSPEGYARFLRRNFKARAISSPKNP